MASIFQTLNRDLKPQNNEQVPNQYGEEQGPLLNHQGQLSPKNNSQNGKVLEPPRNDEKQLSLTKDAEYFADLMTILCDNGCIDPRTFRIIRRTCRTVNKHFKDYLLPRPVGIFLHVTVEEKGYSSSGYSPSAHLSLFYPRFYEHHLWRPNFDFPRKSQRRPCVPFQMTGFQVYLSHLLVKYSKNFRNPTKDGKTELMTLFLRVGFEYPWHFQDIQRGVEEVMKSFSDYTVNVILLDDRIVSGNLTITHNGKEVDLPNNIDDLKELVQNPGGITIYAEVPELSSQL